MTLAALLIVPSSVSAETTRVDVGAASLALVTNGDPVNARYSDHGTPAELGDDKIDVFQSVKLAKASADLRWLRQGGLSSTGTGGAEAGVDLEETIVDQPVFILANQTDEGFYDAHAPQELRRRADVEYNEFDWSVSLRQDPVYKKTWYLPYGIGVKYDKVRFPFTLGKFKTDELVDLATGALRYCTNLGLAAPPICLRNFVSSPHEEIYRLSPSVTFGYAVHEAVAAVRDRDSALSPVNTEANAPAARDVESASLVTHGPKGSTERAGSEANDAERSGTLLAAIAETPTKTSSLPPADHATAWSLPYETILVFLVVLALPLLLLYHRFRRNNVLDHELRRRIFETVCALPGITESDLAVRLGVSRQLIHYHARYLATTGLITIRKFRKQKCFFQNGGRFAEAEQRVRAALRGGGSGRTIRILSVLAEGDSFQQSEVARRVGGISQAGMKWHVERLERMGIVAVVREGAAKRVSLDPYAGPIVRNWLVETRRTESSV